MFIGKVQETGFIEPVMFPRVVPEHEPTPEVPVEIAAPALEPAGPG
ncbi:MAG TPA: hypothetical protein VFP13_04745 [Actinomycetota bacterium]|nr:hypothetical protein [Actinomycetota bacterium]